MSDPLPFGVRFGDLPEYDLSEIMARTARDRWENIREKRWYFLGVTHPEVFVGMAVIRVGLIASAFAYVFDRHSGRLYAHNMIGAPVQVRFDERPNDSMIRFRALRGVLQFDPRGDGYRRRAHCKLTFPGSSIGVELEYGGDEKPNALSMLTPMPRDKFAYTRKMGGLPVTGTVRFPGRRLTFGDGGAWAVEDWTLGYHARETFWNWAAGVGRDARGRLIAFNISGGVYTNEHRENVCWIDGRPYPLPPARFEYDPSKPLEPWRVQSNDGRLDLRFEPEGLRAGDQDFRIIASRFIQPFGRYAGTLAVEGDEARLADAGGVVEEHFAKW